MGEIKGMTKRDRPASGLRVCLSPERLQSELSAYWPRLGLQEHAPHPLALEQALKGLVRHLLSVSAAQAIRRRGELH
jgi:hypothetical protein